MSSRSKNALAGCAALLTLLPSAWLAGAPLRQWLAREAMESRILAGLSDDQLVLFDLSPEEERDIDREWKGREFKHLGRMFDVVRSHRDADGRLQLWCVDDERETRLITETERNGQGDPGSTGTRRLDRITIVQLVVAPVPGGLCVVPAVSASSLRPPGTWVEEQDGVSRVDPPPPKC